VRKNPRPDGAGDTAHPYWIFFGVEKPGTRCDESWEEVERLGRPGQIAKSCWKVLLFPDKVSDYNAAVSKIVRAIERQGKYRGKYSEDVLVIYTSSTEERDELRSWLGRLLGGVNLPYRMGCKMYEGRFGPWREW